jgi:diguanylate cyclase (GGDEF)-like protein
MPAEAERIERHPTSLTPEIECDPDLYAYVLEEILKNYPAEEHGRRTVALQEMLPGAVKRYWQGTLARRDFDSVNEPEKQAMSDYIDMLREIGEVQYRLHKKIDYDQLTGLFNRSAFELHYANEIKRLQKQEAGGGELSVMVCIDLDHLKRINDSMGHSVGSMAIEHLGKQLKKSFRATVAAGRFGGDEFVLMLTAVSKDNLYAAVERVFRACSELRIVKDTKDAYVILTESELRERPDRDKLTVEASVSLSMGVKEIDSEKPVTFDGIMHEADRASFTSKFHGRNAITICTDKDKGKVMKFRGGDLEKPRTVKLRKEGEYENRSEHEESIRKGVDEALNRVLNCVRHHNKNELTAGVQEAISRLQSEMIGVCTHKEGDYPTQPRTNQ